MVVLNSKSPGFHFRTAHDLHNSNICRMRNEKEILVFLHAKDCKRLLEIKSFLFHLFRELHTRGRNFHDFN